jgi:hypothetical protein
MQNDTCYILALIKRDDGERLLLGSGYYEFVAGQKHFNPNQFANDVVELQGADGQLLAGQVRRSTTQTFEGFIGDGTTSKQTVEQKRREFFLFFRKQHHYTVVYIMPDGTAIKRDRGYITEAPAVQELHQFQPKWRIGLAFEDVNYYSYNEDAQGNEIYSFEATLALANIADGGLVWDGNGATSDERVYTGKNLVGLPGITFPYTQSGVTVSREKDGSFTFNGTLTTVTNFDLSPWTNHETYNSLLPYSGQTVTLSCKTSGSVANLDFRNYGLKNSGGDTLVASSLTAKKTVDAVYEDDTVRLGIRFGRGTFNNWNIKIQLELGSTATDYEPYNPGATTGGYVFAPSTGGGPIVVTVNGVDNANPVWHVYGPATNPTLTNSTTGEALTWNGTVPANQELIIDMGAQTATLEGANVFEYVSGSWVQLEPGANRVSYTAANTTKNSKIFWNEVVG